jgi:hypothetical protein
MSSQVLLDIEKHLDDTPQNARTIWRRIDCWSFSSVKQRLDSLAEQGRVLKSSEPCWRGQRSTYRRAA